MRAIEGHRSSTHRAMVNSHPLYFLRVLLMPPRYDPFGGSMPNATSIYEPMGRDCKAARWPYIFSRSPFIVTEAVRWCYTGSDSRHNSRDSTLSSCCVRRAYIYRTGTCIAVSTYATIMLVIKRVILIQHSSVRRVDRLGFGWRHRIQRHLILVRIESLFSLHTFGKHEQRVIFHIGDRVTALAAFSLGEPFCEEGAVSGSVCRELWPASDYNIDDTRVR